MELCDLPAHQIVALIRSKQASAEEVLDSALQRIAQVDGRPGALDPGPALPEDAGKVHAFITLTADLARQQARAVDRAIRSGEDPGELAGVPITVKDIFTVQGAPTTAASRILANFDAPYTATPVERMQRAGALVLGKVNLDEFAFGSSSESSAFQPSPRNPWDTARVPGGSSGGSAAAVAAGECQLSLGTDTAGSIRQPAAFCGVVGLKPTYGRVSRYGMFAFSSSLDCPGPLARNVHDAALMLKVIAGADPHDATSVNLPVPDYPAALGKSVRGLRIGLSPDYFRILFPDPQTGALQQEAITPAIEQAVLQAAQRLAELGAEIVEDVPLPHTGYGIPTFLVISRVEAASNLHRYDGVKYGRRTQAPFADLQQMYRQSRAEGLGQQAKLRILMGMYMSEAEHSEQYYNRARRVRTLIRGDFETVFDPQGAYRLDALLTPPAPTAAFPIANVFGDSVLMQYADQFTVPANHAGVPALALPAGLDPDDLPVGMQLIGPDFSEERLFQIGYAYETATQAEPWRTKRPPVLEG
ncbi:MAG: Asp-tRNA(Asn)/Glu-tRNA(Gln) amidotransferase subunit GatA [Anaerolineales bacterium]|jgi:aspartyl-tRNA(Asn)/glutamyl-tRNA(Gln) amidotransferase subunit A|nr:Asp-tRNA(Asn)/Glu-tRNA(Gln) amidotransferase subunit GatA [Anaerolineales bacterium]